MEDQRQTSQEPVRRHPNEVSRVIVLAKASIFLMHLQRVDVPTHGKSQAQSYRRILLVLSHGLWPCISIRSTHVPVASTTYAPIPFLYAYFSCRNLESWLRI